MTKNRQTDDVLPDRTSPGGYWILQFKPFSISSWVYLLRLAGPTGFATITILMAGKFFDHRGSGEVVSGALSGSMVFRAFFISMTVLLLVPLITKWRLPNGLGSRFALIYVMTVVASTAWSYVPVATLGKSIELAVGFLVVLSAMHYRDGDIRLLAIFNIALYIIYFQLFFICFMFVAGVDGFTEGGAGGLADIVGGRATSPFMSANGVGYNSAIILVVLLNVIAFSGLKITAIALHGGITLCALLVSTSRTSFALVLASVLMIAYYKNRTLFFLIMAPVIAFLLYVLLPQIVSFLIGSGVEGNFYTLSGRTVLWRYSIDLISENPWFGMGYGVGSRVMFYLSQLQGFGDTISTAHNGFLEVLSGVGALGFVPWLLALLYLIVWSVRKYSETTRLNYLYALWPVLVGTTIMSVGVGGAFTETVFIFFVILAYIPMARNARI